MTKKEYVLKLLKALENDRPLAKGLLILIDSWKVDDSTIDGLSQIFMNAVKKVNEKLNTNKLHKSIDLLDKIKRLEWKDMIENKDELDELEKMIDGL